jgi:D-arabinono-1,4-lactone oxidase
MTVSVSRRAAVPKSVGADGFYHPQSEAELKDLVVMASEQGRQCRVRGSAHSVSHVIYGDQLSRVPNEVNHQTPTPGDSVQIMLDLYRGFRVKDEARKLVEVDAGIHLGEDPSDPTHTAKLDTSLVWQLSQKQWALSNLGGVTHQTVSGFTATGSSGGSAQYSVNDNLWGFRVIDASGNVHEVSREDANPGPFYAMAPNLGLLGVVSTLIFECEDEFLISGQEAITTVADCAIDLFGSGTAQRPSLEQFLRDTQYARLEWWPQRGAERVQVWQAQRIQPQIAFRPEPYEEFGAERDSNEVFISLIYTILGNLDELSHARAQIERIFERVDLLLERLPLLEALGPVGEAIAKFLSVGAEKGAVAAIDVLEPFATMIEDEIPTIFPQLLAFFIKLDSEKAEPEKGQPQRFKDYWWHGLPMDNEADDVLLGTAFTEIWVPLCRTQELMELLRSYFEAPTDDHEAYRRTGLYGWELYAAKPTPFWMSASHTEGDDEWKDGVFRIDPYWFAANRGDPAETFYPQFWKLLREHKVPFRLHWGKYQPVYEPGDRSWVNFFKARYPRWEDFLTLRASRDPGDTFLTSYWRERFGL